MCRATEACVGPGDGAYFDHRSRDNACVPAVLEAQEPPRYGRACPATVSHDGLNRRRHGVSALGAADPTDGAMGTRGRTMCRINLGRMQGPVTATAGVCSHSEASLGESTSHGEEGWVL